MGWRVVWLIVVSRDGDRTPYPTWVRYAGFGLAVIAAASVLVWKGWAL